MARNRTLIGTGGLDGLKFEVAGELVPQIRRDPRARVAPRAPGPAPAGAADGGDFDRGDFDRLKFELARDLGVPLQPGYNGALPAREAGRLGGKIGGNMVRRLITQAEELLRT